VPTIREIFFEILAWLAVAVFCAACFLTIWHWAKKLGLKLMPVSRERNVPWTGLEIAAVFFFTRFSWPMLVGFGLIHLGFFSWLYGWEEAVVGKAMDDNAKAEINLWLMVWIFPLNLATVILMLRFASGTQAENMGLSVQRPRENLALASFIWLAVTPIVIGVGFLVSLGHYELTGTKPEPHLLQRLAEQSPTPMNAVLIGISALVIAPIWEELMFRGVLQPWLTQREWGGHLGMGLAALIGIIDAISALKELSVPTIRMIVVTVSPFVFVLLMIPGYLYADRLLKKWIPGREVVQGIFATALLFGMVHSSNWPTPIPLFVLGLALGYLSYRTQTLLAPILLHSLFNLVACLTLVFPHVFPDWPNGREETSVPKRSVPTATSTRVPGSKQLRLR
jgi:membrane protease YdiL (CAAX protease family)